MLEFDTWPSTHTHPSVPRSLHIWCLVSRRLLFTSACYVSERDVDGQLAHHHQLQEPPQAEPQQLHRHAQRWVSTAHRPTHHRSAFHPTHIRQTSQNKIFLVDVPLTKPNILISLQQKRIFRRSVESRALNQSEALYSLLLYGLKALPRRHKLISRIYWNSVNCHLFMSLPIFYIYIHVALRHSLLKLY